MDTRSEIREFLTSRRAKLTPEQAGLPHLRHRSRVASRDCAARRSRCSPGSASTTTPVSSAATRPASRRRCWRRSRVRCSSTTPSATHLFDLARATHDAAPKRRRRGAARRPAERAAHARRDDRRRPRSSATAGSTSSPRTGSAAPSTRSTSTARARPPNTARFVFLDARAPRASTSTGTASPPTSSRSCAPRRGATRTTASLSDLVGELSTRSELFRTLWAAHDVRIHDTGTKRFRHPLVGELDLTLRDDGARRRPRPDDVRLHRRARLEIRARP